MMSLVNSIVLVLCFWGTGMALANTNTEYISRLPEGAVKSIGLMASPASEYSPAVTNATIALPFVLDVSAQVTLDILSADGDLIRRVIDKVLFTEGKHAVQWDGRDEDGLLVPDEAYVPHFRATVGDTIFVDDPASYSGGEIIPNINWSRTSETSVSYELPAASRVLVRLGIKDGPMVRELRHWKPATAGQVVDRWNGYDVNDVDYIADRDDLWVVVMAYQIPLYSVITSGNTEYDYRDYRVKRGWGPVLPELENMMLERNGVRLSQDYFLPRAYLPRVSLQHEGNRTSSRVGLIEVEDTVRFTINVPPEDRWILNSSFYETGLYIDYQFQSEEEQGFVPMIWEYDASELSPGRHTATVQLFGFGGFISSSTLEFFKK